MQKKSLLDLVTIVRLGSFYNALNFPNRQVPKQMRYRARKQSLKSAIHTIYRYIQYNF